MRTHPTTPFGRRPLSLAMVATQAATRDFAAKPDASETVVHKWRLFRALTEAKGPLGVTDRALSVLHALLSFHQETALTLPRFDNCRRSLLPSKFNAAFPFSVITAVPLYICGWLLAVL